MASKVESEDDAELVVHGAVDVGDLEERGERDPPRVRAQRAVRSDPHDAVPGLRPAGKLDLVHDLGPDRELRRELVADAERLLELALVLVEAIAFPAQSLKAIPT